MFINIRAPGGRLRPHFVRPPLTGHREILSQDCPLKDVVKTMTIKTANGETHADLCVDVAVADFGTAAALFNLLWNTPAVLTIGRRCSEEYCILIWKLAQDTCMITLEGMVVVF